MNEHEEIRRAVRAEYGTGESTPQIDERLRKTYESLGEMPQGKKAMGKRLLLWAGSAAGGFAACFLLLLGVGFANPAFAEQLPLVNNLIQYFKQGQGQYFQSPMITDGGIDAYLQPVQQEKDGFAVTGVYCDGITLLLATELTVENAPEGLQTVEPECVVAVNGQTLGYNWYNTMERMEGNRFVGTQILDVSALNLEGDFSVTVELKGAVSVDTKLMVFGEDGDYHPKEYDLQRGPVILELAATADASLRKTYEVNEDTETLTLKRITVTPALTRVEYTAKDTVVPVLKDDKGNEIRALGKYGPEKYGTVQTADVCAYFYPLEEDVSALNLDFYQRSDKYTPAEQFAIPVEGGYGQRFDENQWREERKTDNTDVVYDPPIEENSAYVPPAEPALRPNEVPGAQTVELGETAQVLNDKTIIDSGALKITFDNMRVYSNYGEAGIEEKDMVVAGSDAVAKARAESADNRFVLFDITIQTEEMVTESPACPSEENGLHEFGILNFAHPDTVNPMQTEDASWVSTEIEYFSGHQNGFTDYYHFSQGHNETKTYQVGYIVPLYELVNGNFCLFSDMTGGRPWNWEELQAKGEISWDPGIFLNIPPYDEQQD